MNLDCFIPWVITKNHVVHILGEHSGTVQHRQTYKDSMRRMLKPFQVH